MRAQSSSMLRITLITVSLSIAGPAPAARASGRLWWARKEQIPRAEPLGLFARWVWSQRLRRTAGGRVIPRDSAEVGSVLNLSQVKGYVFGVVVRDSPWAGFSGATIGLTPKGLPWAFIPFPSGPPKSHETLVANRREQLAGLSPGMLSALTWQQRRAEHVPPQPIEEDKIIAHRGEQLDALLQLRWLLSRQLQMPASLARQVEALALKATAHGYLALPRRNPRVFIWRGPPDSRTTISRDLARRLSIELDTGEEWVHIQQTAADGRGSMVLWSGPYRSDSPPNWFFDLRGNLAARLGAEGRRVTGGSNHKGALLSVVR